MFEDDDELESLKQQQQDAADKKAYLGVAGSVAQSLGDVPTASEIFYKRQAPKSNAKAMFDSVAGSVVDPMEREQKAMAYLKAKREGRLAREEDAMTKQKKDAGSAYSLAARAYAKKYGIPVDDSTTGYDIDQMMDQKKMRETEAQSQMNFGNQVELEKLKQRGDLAKIGAQARLDQSKKDAEAKADKGKMLSAEAVAKLGNARSAMKSIKDLRDSVNNTNDFVPVIGNLNPARYFPGTDTNTRMKNYDAQVTPTMQNIGTYLEGGKLSDGDFKSKYLPMAPVIADSDDARKGKIDNLERLMKNRYNEELAALRASGYDVSKFENEGEIPDNPLAGNSQRGSGGDPGAIAEIARRAAAKNTAGR